MSSISYLLVGLGNPGAKYTGTRHNIGFEVMDALANHCRSSFHSRFDSLITDVMIESSRVILIKPQTFMNVSGKAVSEVSQFYKILPERVVVVYDDIDLPSAQLRIRKTGGPGGHNGMKSIIEQLGTEDFPRVRVGIGRSADPSDHVLSRFSKPEKELMEKAVERAANALQIIVTEGIERAMNNFNRDEGPPSEP